MLGKLLKHELYATGRLMLPALAALVLLAGMANLSYRGLEMTDTWANSTLVARVLEITAVFMIVIFFLGLFAAGVLAMVLMVQRFYKNLLGNEGYLMFTLPVSVHGLIWSKLLISCLWIAVTSLACLGLFVLTIVNFTSLGFQDFFDSLHWLSQSLQELYAQTAMTPGDMAGYITELTLLILATGLSQCLHFYAAMATGHSFAKNKVLLSIVFYLAIGLGLQLLQTAFGLLIPLSRIDILRIDTIWTAGLHGIFLSLAAYEILKGLILYLLTWLPLKNGLNLG